jgi:hypothetical protein
MRNNAFFPVSSFLDVGFARFPFLVPTRYPRRGVPGGGQRIRSARKQNLLPVAIYNWTGDARDLRVRLRDVGLAARTGCRPTAEPGA